MTPTAPSADQLRGSTGPDFLTPPRPISYTSQGDIPPELVAMFIQKVDHLQGLSKIDNGIGLVSWNGFGTFSDTSTFTHNLGTSSITVVASIWYGIQNHVLNYAPSFYVNNITTTTFDVRASTVDASVPTASTEVGVMWIAMTPQGSLTGPLP